MLSFRLSADVRFVGSKKALTVPGNCCAHAALALSSISKTTANRFTGLFNVVPLRLKALNVAHLLRATGERIRELAFVSRTEVGEIQAGRANGRVRGGSGWWTRRAG